jgi:hypothetical protein
LFLNFSEDLFRVFSKVYIEGKLSHNVRIMG